MSLTLTERLLEFARTFWGEEDELTVQDAEVSGDILSQVEEARLEWLAARSYFENATETALVDHAILSLQAAEKKYVYLLERAKQFGVRREAYSPIPRHRME